MLFNSLEFIYLFLPLAVTLHFLAARWSESVAAAVTIISSLVFYAWWKPPFVILPVISIAANYWLARRILLSDVKTARRIMLMGVFANLLVLGYFKYFDFLISIVEQRNPITPDVPLALSFTTFVQVAFLVELARDRTPIALPRYAMFVSFFPHLIAGPIVRWTELGPQLARSASLSRRLEQCRPRPDRFLHRARQEGFICGQACSPRRGRVRCGHCWCSDHRRCRMGGVGRIFGSVVFRFLRLLGHGRGAGTSVQFPAPNQLCCAISRHEHN